MSVVHVNVRDLKSCGKFAYIEYLASVNISVIAVSETWLSVFDAASYNINNYTHYSVCRTLRSGGGISLFVKDEISLISSSERSSTEEDIQTLRLHLKFNENVVYILLVYSSSTLMHAKLVDILDLQLPRSTTPCVVLGDMNVNLLSSDSRTSGYLSFFAVSGFHGLINCITRPDSGTCLDHLFVSNFDNTVVDSYGVIETRSISDHFPVYLNCRFPVHCSLRKDLYEYKRVFSKRNYRDFRSYCSYFDWSFIMSCSHVDEMLECFNNCLFSIYDHCFPLQKVLILNNKNDNSRWFSHGLKKIRKSLDLSAKLYFTNKTAEHKSRYYTLLMRYRKACRSSRSRFNNYEISKVSSSVKLLWQYVNKKCGRATKRAKIEKLINTTGAITDSERISTEFCKFFFQDWTYCGWHIRLTVVW